MLNPDDPEFQRSAKPQSVFVNRAYVTMVDGTARLSFGEAPANSVDAQYSVAVSMSVQDAMSLADAIYRVFDEAYPPPPPPPPASDPFSGIAGISPRLGGKSGG